MERKKQRRTTKHKLDELKKGKNEFGRYSRRRRVNTVSWRISNWMAMNSLSACPPITTAITKRIFIVTVDDCGGAMEATVRIRADEFSTSCACRNFTFACTVRHMSENRTRRLSGVGREKKNSKNLKTTDECDWELIYIVSWCRFEYIGWLPKVWASIFSFCSFRCVSIKNDVDECTYAYASMRMHEYCNEIICFVFLSRSHHARTRSVHVLWIHIGVMKRQKKKEKTHIKTTEAAWTVCEQRHHWTLRDKNNSTDDGNTINFT